MVRDEMLTLRTARRDSLLIYDKFLRHSLHYPCLTSGRFAADGLGAYLPGRSNSRCSQSPLGFEHPPLPNRESPMQTYYFDMKDGAAIRDRAGLEFRTDSQAIEHSKILARRLSHEHADKDQDLCVIVLNETGSEIHREPVYPTSFEPAS